jgi:glutathionyl-hydroquinone reductase
LKGLQDIISITNVHYTFSDLGWKFAEGDECSGAEVDPLYGAKYVRDIYLRANEHYDGRFTVPVLWDKKTETIVNNESRCTPRGINLS